MNIHTISSQYQNYRRIALIVIHCSATRCDRDFPVEALRHAHVHGRNYADIGYHFYITRDGIIHCCRPVDHIGAHARGWNEHSLGGCIDQKIALIALLRQLRRDYPDTRIMGHRELSASVHKACPCFTASREYQDL